MICLICILKKILNAHSLRAHRQHPEGLNFSVIMGELFIRQVSADYKGKHRYFHYMSQIFLEVGLLIV
ncbi:hypothetical protein AD932_00325 [Gluconobacter oxydans]|nr:hypothetical protein AD932_00325 [Gluconobacter oxydans]